MKYQIRHITEYDYAEPVSHCYNLAHLIPRSSLRQRCLSSQVSISPITVVTSQRQDYFGNQAYHFEVQRAHQSLVIESLSVVETEPQHTACDLDFGTSCAESLALMENDHAAETLLAREFALSSPMVPILEELKAYAEPSFSPDRPLLSAVMELTQRIFKEFTYCSESTTLSTPLTEVLATKKGVCQDFAHLQIGCLRALGYAAKYVSGYIETLPPPGQEKLVGADASHAWLSVYSPREGWVEFDPTNNCMAGEQHIITAWGRDYFDVTPLKGVIFGGGEAPVMNVSVDVSRQFD